MGGGGHAPAPLPPPMSSEFAMHNEVKIFFSIARPPLYCRDISNIGMTTFDPEDAGFDTLIGTGDGRPGLSSL